MHSQWGDCAAGFDEATFFARGGRYGPGPQDLIFLFFITLGLDVSVTKIYEP